MIYKEEILDHYKHPQNFGLVGNPTHKGNGANASCGDVIEMSVTVEDGVIKEVGFEGTGCALSTAASSMLTEFVKGKKVEEVLKMNDGDIKNLTGEVNVGRLRCVTLPLRVLQKTLETKE
jgi:nitrogen fixation NifU-like protein